MGQDGWQQALARIQALESAASGVAAATTPVSSAVINLPGIGLDVETVFFSADVGGTPVLAWGLEGDAFPRVVIAGDPNWGIWFGGGNTDPTLGFSAINGDGIGVGLWGQTGARVDCRANAVHVHGDDFEVTTPSVFFTALPTVDPGVSGGLWVDAGVLKISP